MSPHLAVLQEIPDAPALWREARRLAPLPCDAEDVFQDMLVDAVKQERYLERTQRPRGVIANHCRRRSAQRLYKYGDDCLDARQRKSRFIPAVDEELNQWLEDYFFQTTAAEADSNTGLLWFIEELTARLTPFEVEVLLCAWEWAQSDRKATCAFGNERATADRQATLMILARELQSHCWQVKVALCNIREVAQKLGVKR